MVQSLESRIHKLLLEHRDSLKVADLLLADWRAGKLSWSDQEASGHFLIHCGYTKALLDQIRTQLKNSNRLPWAAFLEALSRSQVQLTKEDLDQIFIGAAEEGALKDLVRCTGYDSVDGRFQKIRNSVDNTILKAENQQVFYSKTAESGQASTDTHHISNLVSHPAKPKTETDLVPETKPSSPQPLLESIITRAKLQEQSLRDQRQLVFKHFEKALAQQTVEFKDAVVALTMMEAWEEALQILRSRKEKESCDPVDLAFIEIQLLLHSGKYLEALSFIEVALTLKLNSTQRGQIFCFRAEALLGLQQTKQACDCLVAALDENPENLNAQILLNRLFNEKKTQPT